MIPEDIVILINCALYFFLFLYCFKKYGFVNFSTIISLVYAISSIMGALLFFLPLYDQTYTSDGHATIEACLYQFSLLSLLILSVNNCNIEKCKCVYSYNSLFILKCQKFFTIMLVLFLLFSFPESVRRFFSGIELADMRAEIYGTNTTNSFFIIALIARLFGAVPLLLLVIAAINFFVFKQFGKWDKLSVLVYICFTLNTVFSAIARATIIHSLIEVFVIIIFFRSYISRKFKRKIVIYSLVIIPIVYSVFMAISLSRFKSDEKSFLLQQYTSIRYAGEAQVNFMTLMYPDLKETFKGFTQFSLFRRVLGLSYDDGLGRDGTSVFNAYIKRFYQYEHPTYIFYGLSGLLYCNWGFWGALLIAMFIYYYHRKGYYDPVHMSYMQMVVSLFLATYLLKGVCYGVYQNESGNLLFVYIMLISVYLRKKGYLIKI